MELHVAVKLLRTGARLPEYATAGAAGLDLYACLDRPISLPPGRVTLVPTGLAVASPAGYVGLIRDRSGLAVAGLQAVAGVIDSDYRGEVMVALHNAAASDHLVKPGERVAQVLFLPCPTARLEEVGELPTTQRGEGGFGSTGR